MFYHINVLESLEIFKRVIKFWDGKTGSYNVCSRSVFHRIILKGHVINVNKVYRLYYCIQLSCEFFQTNVKKINE